MTSRGQCPRGGGSPGRTQDFRRGGGGGCREEGRGAERGGGEIRQRSEQSKQARD